MGKPNFDDVGDFHEKFDLDNVTHRGVGPRFVSDDLVRFRIKFLREELNEFIESYEQGDTPGMFDALLDLAYVTFGTAQLLGFPWQDGWDEVQRANMTKERAASDGSDSKRRSMWDVVKPYGWQPPDIGRILASAIPTKCRQCQRNLTDVALKEVIAGSTQRVDIHCPCGAYLGSRPV